MIAQSALEPLGLSFGFFEYAIVGLPLIAIATVISMIVLPIAFPFYP